MGNRLRWLMLNAGAAAALALVAPGAMAGPTEDYAAGKKAYLTDDLPTAMRLLGRASGAGYAPAQALLAQIVAGAGDDAQALALYRKSAAQGDPDGQYGLATMYAIGEAVPRNSPEAVRLLEAAAEQGHGPAGETLGEAYLSGELGLEQDPARGRALLEQAAAAGYGPAQAKLETLAGSGATGTQGAEASGD